MKVPRYHLSEPTGLTSWIYILSEQKTETKKKHLCPRVYVIKYKLAFCKRHEFEVYRPCFVT